MAWAVFAPNLCKIDIRLLPLGLWLVSGQMAARLPATLGPMACFWTNGRQLACRPWAYGLFQNKSPPACLLPLGLWLVSGQMAASLPAALGPMACFRTNGRYLACDPWAYGLFQGKSPPACLRPLGLWLVSGQMAADPPVALGPMACFRTNGRQLACCLIRRPTRCSLHPPCRLPFPHPPSRPYSPRRLSPRGGP